MTYRATIPQANDFLSISQGEIQTNFTKVNDYLLQNHGKFITDDLGKHTFVTLTKQSGDPATAVDEIALFCFNDAANNAQLFFRPENTLAGGNKTQMSPFPSIFAWVVGKPEKIPQNKKVGAIAIPTNKKGDLIKYNVKNFTYERTTDSNKNVTSTFTIEFQNKLTDSNIYIIPFCIAKKTGNDNFFMIGTLVKVQEKQITYNFINQIVSDKFEITYVSFLIFGE